MKYMGSSIGLESAGFMIGKDGNKNYEIAFQTRISSPVQILLLS